MISFGVQIRHGAGFARSIWRPLATGALARANAFNNPGSAKDRQTPGDWHVQWTDDAGGFEMAIFSGPRAHERAIMFAERCYSGYEEVRTGEGV